MTRLLSDQLMPVPVDPDAFSTIEAALDDIRRGHFVVVVDTADPEQEGGLTIAAQHASPEAVNFMLSQARGPLYLCLDTARCEALGLRPVGANSARSGAAYMMSIEARDGITSGVSAADRSRTVRLAADPATEPSELSRPGHVPVLQARPGGVLERARQTEAAVDLARLAGLHPGAVVAEILNQDGSVAVLAELVEFCATHEIRLVTTGDLVAYRRRSEKLVERIASARMPTEYGDFTAVAFRELMTGDSHVALVKGDIAAEPPPLVRVHTQCLLGDVFQSTFCDCADELHAAFARIEQEGRGVVLYMSRPGRGLGLLRRIEPAADTTPAPAATSLREDMTDARDYGIGNQILHELGVVRLRLLTDNPRDLPGLERYGLELVAQVPLRFTETAHAPREHHQDFVLDDSAIV